MWEKKPSNNTQKWKLCSFWDDDKGVFAWDVTLQRASLSHVTTELVLVKTAIIWLLDGGSLWKSPRLLLCLCLSVYERVRASVWNLCTMTFFCWKQVRGGGEGKKKLGRHLFIVLITANKRNKDQFGKQSMVSGFCRLFEKNFMTLLHGSVQLKNKKSIITFLWIL